MQNPIRRLPRWWQWRLLSVLRGPVAAARHGEVADARQNPCARTAEYQFRCDPARPRALDGSSADRANGVAQGSARR